MLTCFLPAFFAFHMHNYPAQEPLSVVDGQSNVAPETGIGIFDLPINTTYLEECDGAKYITQEVS